MGSLISSLVDFASPAGQVDNVTDSNAAAVLGIAVTAANNTSGNWFYSTDGGGTWNSLGAVGDTTARLLAADVNTRIYFQPAANYSSSIADAITFRAWDQTSGSNGSFADTSANGGTTAFSIATVTASLVINPVNDAPVGTDNTISTLRDSAYTFTVSDFGFSDVDGDNFTAVTVSSLPSVGTLYVDADGDAMYDSGEEVGANNSVSIADINSGRLKFSPVAGASGSAYTSFSFKVQDDGGTDNGGVDSDQSPNTMTINVNEAYRITGNIYEDINGDSLLDDAVGTASVTVYLFQDSDANGVISAGDTLYASTSTDLSGHYRFNSLLDDTYFVVIDSRTIAPAAGLNAGFSQTSVWAEQTYGSAGAAHGAGFQLAAGALFGGRSLGVSDDASSLLTAQHATRVVVAGSDTANIDSAFSFSVVSTTTDGDHDATSNRTIQGSLRQFIQNSNALVGVQTSQFQLQSSDPNYNLDGNQAWTIRPTSALPTISDAIVLDGLTQAGASADAIGGQHQLKVFVDGINVPDAASGFHIVAGNSVVRGFAIDRFGNLVAYSGSAILLSGVGGNLVETNFLGLDVSGSSGTGNYAGVEIMDTTGTLTNQIGGSSVGSRNVFANSVDGIYIHPSGSFTSISTSTLIIGNYIGTDRTGTVAMGHSWSGVDLEWLGPSGVVQIGGFGIGEANLISGNVGHGIVLNGRGRSVENAQILGNLVGVAADGVTALSNQGSAIYLLATVKSAASVSNNRIEGNVLAASYRGIEAAGNVDGNQIVNNFIGTDASGTVDLGNIDAGIHIEATAGGKNPENNLIQNNVIAYNHTNGVTLIGGVGNTIRQNSVYSNVGLGIYLSGYTSNDGALTPGVTNQAMDTAIVSSANLVNDQLTLSGYVGSAPGDTAFANTRVEFFIADSSGQGRTYLGFLTTNSSGNYSGMLSVSGVIHTDKITATATLTGIGTSQFGGTTDVNVAPTITSDGGGLTATISIAETTTHVTTVAASDLDTGTTLVYSIAGGADSLQFQVNSTTGALTFISAPDFEMPSDVGGDNVYDVIVRVSDGSLSDDQAIAVTVIDVSSTLTISTASDTNDSGILVGAQYTIEWLNAHMGADGKISLREAIIAANNTAGHDTITFEITGPGVHRIDVLNSLPSLTDSITIDGYSQAGASANTLMVGSDAVLLIELNGSGAGANVHGLTLASGSDGSTIRGLVINRFDRDGISISGSHNNIIVGNFLGTDASGSAAQGNFQGVYVTNSSGTIIGGTDAASRNVISGNRQNGIAVAGAASTSTLIAGNYIGTDVTGTSAVGNAQHGIFLSSSAAHTTIGGTTAGLGNLITASGNHGVQVSSTGVGNAVLGNSIYGNTKLGINHGSDTVYTNDGLVNSGADGQGMDHPVMTTANLVSDTLNIAGYVGSAAGQTAFAGARVEVFLADVDGTGYGEGKTFLGYLTADASGNFSGALDVTGRGLTDASVLTATATSSSSNTSEFGQNFNINSTPTDIAPNSFSVVEQTDTTSGYTVGGLSTTDPDSGDTFTYSIVGGADAAKFSISGSQLILTDGVLDFETKPTYSVTVRTTDAGGLFYDETLTVQVTDINDEQVLTTNAGATVAENSTANVITIGMLQTTDEDNTDGQLVYTITLSSANGTLKVNGVALALNDTFTQADINAGIVTYGHDGSETALDSFGFTVDDGAGGVSTGTFDFTITPVNDNSPVFTSNGGVSSGSLNVAENSTLVTTIAATDADLPGQTVTFSIAGGADAWLFTLDANTGVLSFVSGRDRENHTDVDSDGVYEVSVIASDGTLTDTQNLSVTITDVDEFAVSVPTDANAADDEVEENVAIGTSVGITANAFDSDATSNTISYSLTSNPDGLFQIDASTGVISTAATIDRELHGASRSITVLATSADGSTQTQTFSIAINDVDEFDVSVPTDGDPTGNFVDENSASGTLVGITAYSVDNDASNNGVVYTLDDNDGGRFEIDGLNGQVRLVGALDYETDGPQRTIRVRATSVDGSTSAAGFVIQVGPVNEAPVARRDEYSTSYLEELILAAPGVAINDYDPDGDAFSVVLVGGTGPGTAVLLSDGSLRYRPQFGFVGDVTLQYYVTDGALDSRMQTIVIHVKMPQNVQPPGSGGDGTKGGGSSSGSTSSSGGSGGSGGSNDQVTEHAPYEGGPIQASTEDGSSVAVTVAAALTTNDSLPVRSLQTAVDFDFGTLVVGNLQTNDFLHGLNKQELSRLVLPQLERHLLTQAQADQSIDVLSDQRQNPESVDGMLIQVDPLVATALGTGLVIWLIQLGQFAAALLSTASAWVQLDPLTVIQGSETLAGEPGEAEGSEEMMFEEAKIERTDDR